MNDLEAPSSVDERWSRAIILLSLDVALPFYPMLGLRIISPAAFQKALRAFIREYRTQFYSDEHGQNGLRTSSATAFIAAHHSSEASHAFDWWFQNMYCEATKEHIALHAWSIILRFARKSDSAWRALHFPDVASNEARQRFNEAINMDDYRSLCDEAWHPALSDWDLHLYAICLWDDDSMETPN